jgi:hypothetical protein
VKHHNCPSLLTRYKPCRFGRNRSVTKGTLLLSPKQFSVPVSPRIAAGWLTHNIWHSLYTWYNRCKFGQNRSVAKGTLLLKPKQFPMPISTRIKAGILKHHTSQPMLLATIVPSLVEIGQKRRALYSWERKFFVRLATHCSGVTHTSHLALPTHALQSMLVWSKSVSNEGHFTLVAETVFRPYLASHFSGET